MQDDQQLPRAPTAFTYCICFSSLSVVTGLCLSVRDLGFRDSDMCQMSFCVCAVQIFPWHFGWLVVFFFFFPLCCTQTTFSIWVAQSIYSSTVCMMLYLQHHQTTFQCTIIQQHCFILRTLYLSMSLCATETNTQAKAFRFLLIISLFTFSAKTCSSVSMLSFSLNSSSVGGQALETTEDFVAIQGCLIFSLITDSWWGQQEYIPFNHFPWLWNHVTFIYKWNGEIWQFFENENIFFSLPPKIRIWCWVNGLQSSWRCFLVLVCVSFFLFSSIFLALLLTASLLGSKL